MSGRVPSMEETAGRTAVGRSLPIAREGFPFVVTPMAVGGLMLMAGFRRLGLAGILLGSACAYFFRDPDRRAPTGDGLLVAPADGRVMEVVTTPDGTRVSTFLSILDVHINRAPCAGKIRRIEYHPGRFLPAWKSAASHENEQNRIEIETPRGSVRVTQIAGVLARRIVSWVRSGQEVAAGARIGLIRFGSRVDLEVPPDVRILVRVGAMLRAGETVVGEWQ